MPQQKLVYAAHVTYLIECVGYRFALYGIQYCDMIYTRMKFRDMYGSPSWTKKNS